MSGQHAKLAPSSAYLWGPEGCAGAIQMEALQPPAEETEESREGDAAHWALCRSLRKLPVAVGDISENGVPVDASMLEASQELTSNVFNLLAEWKAAGDDFDFENERTLPPALLVHASENWGTPDVVLINWTRKLIVVLDYKYGHGFVDAYRNWQLVNYAALVVEAHDVRDWRGWGRWSFRLGVYQPRCYTTDPLGTSLRFWGTSGEELGEMFEGLRDAALLALVPGAKLRTGDHCQHCRAQWDCPASQRLGGILMDFASEQGTCDMDPSAIGLEGLHLDKALRYLGARKKAVDAKIEELLDRGESVPFHRVEFGNPRTVWRKELAPKAASLVAMFGVEVSPGVALPTPKECLKKGVDAEVIAPYTTTNAPSKSVKIIDDNEAIKIFGCR